MTNYITKEVTTSQDSLNKFFIIVSIELPTIDPTLCSSFFWIIIKGKY